MSRQSMQMAIGNTDAKDNFNKLDEEGNRCGEINQYSLDYALNNTDADTIKRYNSIGKKLTIGDDLGP